MMKPDRIERAHLRDPRDLSHTIHRYEPPADLAGLVQRFWIPVWSVEPGRDAVQRVLQYPCALLVVASDYARFYGVVSGLSTTTLIGEGWAVGVRRRPGIQPSTEEEVALGLDQMPHDVAGGPSLARARSVPAVDGHGVEQCGERSICLRIAFGRGVLGGQAHGH